MDQETLEQIQTRIAFLERANAELGEVVFQQQKEIQALTARVRDVLQRLEAAHNAQDERMVEDERPPHY
jgi:SlyX protein